MPLVVSPGGYRVLERVHSLTWGTPDPVELRTRNGTKLLLDLAILYEIVHLPGDRDFGPYKVKTRGYMHTVQTADEAEIFAYHWHPSSNSHETGPHLHIGSSALNPAGVLRKKMHIPTGRISVEETLRFCISEIGVEPLRDDWLPVLADGEDLFRMYRSWSSDPREQDKS